MTTPDPPADPWEARVREGDRSAMAALFAEHSVRLRRWVEVRLDPRLRGRLSPSDVLQEVFIAAQQRMEHFRGLPEMPFRVWIRLLADQRLAEVHRRHLGAQARDAGLEVTARSGGSSSQGLAARLAADLTSPSGAAVRRETVEILVKTVEAMEPIDREVLTLRHFEEMTNDEVAQVLNLPKGTASKRYIRALTRLREALEGVPGLFDPS